MEARQGRLVLGLSREEMMEKDEMWRRKRHKLKRAPLYFTRLKKDEFDEETQRLLMAEEERNPHLTIFSG